MTIKKAAKETGTDQAVVIDDGVEERISRDAQNLEDCIHLLDAIIGQVNDVNSGGNNAHIALGRIHEMAQQASDRVYAVFRHTEDEIPF